MSDWDVLKEKAVADKQAGTAPLTGTGTALTQEQTNVYDTAYKAS